MQFRVFIEKFPSDDAEARQYLESVLWAKGRFCPHCGSLKSWVITGKTARAGLYQCIDCDKQFTVTTKTPMHSTKLPIFKWLEAMYHICMSSKGVSSVVLAKLIGVTQKTAWKMGHAIREMMASRDAAPSLTGTVELDEKYIGGKPRTERDAEGNIIKHKRGKGTDKQPVFVAVERKGQVRTRVIDDTSTATLDSATKRFVQPSAHLMTDENTAYKSIGKDFAGHETVNHGAKEFARNGVHNNTAESFNATLERAKIGVFHYISKEHLHRYLAEAEFRWNQRAPMEITRRGKPVVEMQPVSLMTRLGSALSVAFGRQLRRSKVGGLRAV